jgi:hypothetical protein
MKTIECSTCGAGMIINDNVSFTTCLYCGNNLAICNKTINDLNIKKIIPFEIDKEEAITNYKKLFRVKVNVIDANKVYVPVLLCNYDFVFSIYYEYEQTDSDDRTTYHDTEELIDGRADNDIIFGNSKVNNVFFQNELLEKNRLDFDPVLLNDVSIEYATMPSKDEINNRIDSDIYHYSYSKIRRKISDIYSMNYFASNLEIENFTTLVPIYIIKTDNGMIYNIPGVKLNKANKVKKEKKIRAIIIGAILLAVYLFVMYIYSKSPNGDSIAMMIMFTLVAAVPALILFIYWYVHNYYSKRSFENFSYKKYSFGDKRKHLK